MQKSSKVAESESGIKIFDFRKFKIMTNILFPLVFFLDLPSRISKSLLQIRILWREKNARQKNVEKNKMFWV